MFAKKFNRGGRIFDSFGFIETLIELYRFLKVSIAVRQLHAPLLPPKQIGTDSDKTVRCVPISDAAQEFVDPKYFLQDNDAWPEARRRQRDVRLEPSAVE